MLRVRLPSVPDREGAIVHEQGQCPPREHTRRGRSNRAASIPSERPEEPQASFSLYSGHTGPTGQPVSFSTSSSVTTLLSLLSISILGSDAPPPGSRNASR